VKERLRERRQQLTAYGEDGGRGLGSELAPRGEPRAAFIVALVRLGLPFQVWYPCGSLLLSAFARVQLRLTPTGMKRRWWWKPPCESEGSTMLLCWTMFMTYFYLSGLWGELAWGMAAEDPDVLNVGCACRFDEVHFLLLRLPDPPRVQQAGL